jgi:histidine ammonia-lyase
MYEINQQTLSLEKLTHIIKTAEPIALSAESKAKVVHCYQYLQNKVAASEQSFYGINTGFGSLCNVKIEKEELEKLQSNLVQSHAFGRYV